MKPPRAHHFIPQCYLKGFVFELKKKSRLWVYEKGKEPRKSTPKNEAHIRDYYATEKVGTAGHEIEDGLAQLEGTIAPLLRKLEHRECELKDIDFKERQSLSVFIAIQFLRVPTGRQYLKDLSSKVMERVAPAGDHNKDKFFAAALKDDPAITEDQSEIARQMLVAEFARRNSSNEFNLYQVLHYSKKLAELFVIMPWKLLRAGQETTFITSDNPVVTIGISDNGKPILGTGFDRTGTTIYFPLNSKRCLQMSKNLTDQSEEIISDQLVIGINEAMMAFAEKFIYGREFSRETAELFSRIGSRIKYGENAFVAFDKRSESL